jgi:hypothetical protein
MDKSDLQLEQECPGSELLAQLAPLMSSASRSLQGITLVCGAQRGSREFGTNT